MNLIYWRRFIFSYFLINFATADRLTKLLSSDDLSENTYGERKLGIPYRFRVHNTEDYDDSIKFLISQRNLILREQNMLYITDMARTKCFDQGIDTRLLIGVISSAKNIKQRKIIRYSWGRFLFRYHIALVFIVGSVHNNNLKVKLDEEQMKNRDLIRINMLDTYRNLTFKTISLLIWTKKYCPHVKFVLKVDDDVFLNMRNLLNYINTLNPNNKFLYGQVVHGGTPVREKNSKSYIAMKDYQGIIFPPYLNGPTYLIPKTVVHGLITTALTNRFINLEDVFITGILAARLKIVLKHNRYFLIDYSTFLENYEDERDVTKFIAIHDLNFDAYKKIYKLCYHNFSLLTA